MLYELLERVSNIRTLDIFSIIKFLVQRIIKSADYICVDSFFACFFAIMICLKSLYTTDINQYYFFI